MSSNHSGSRAGQRKGALVLASHNVGGPGSAGLEARLQAAASEWVDARYDIICVQEAKLEYAAATRVVSAINTAAAARAAALRRPMHSGFDFVYCVNPSMSCSAGCLILWRRQLVAAGALEILPEQPNDRDTAGRLMLVRLKWGGHNIQLGCVYCPNDSVARQTFLSSTVAAAWQQQPNASVFMGDWNYCEEPWHDRRSNAANMIMTDEPSRRAWQQAAPAALDAFRLRHPTKHTYTFFHSGNGHIARLDRVYISPALAASVAACYVVPSTVSDHHPVVLELAAIIPHKPTGPGVKRAQLDFLRSYQHQQDLKQWLEGEIQHAPVADGELLQWWPAFKARLLSKAHELRSQWRKDTTPVLFVDAQHQVQLAVHQLVHATGQQQIAVAMAAVAAARQQLRDIQTTAWTNSWRAQRHQWIHKGERPNPNITQQLKCLEQVSVSKRVIALRTAAGDFVWEGAAPAGVAIAQWAGVSKQPVVDPAAQAEVLAAVRNFPRQPATADGSPIITESQVKKALSASNPGTAPGLDGLPVQLYKRFSDLFVPLLANVFTAIGRVAATPQGFLDGMIIGIFKAGDVTLAANYRPITLLNIDYRLLAKILSSRLQSALAKAIAPTQTAFVKGRCIGHNIITMQLMLHALPDDSDAVAALLDFTKAYDTLDRPFLLSIMQEMGVGADFCGWVKLMLTNTCACAYMNGYTSHMKPFVAGVRQGCPLSPLLYLFVGEALHRFLMSKHMQVSVHGVDLTATQFADDTQVFLPNATAVPAFIEVMDRMASASGQKLNLSKSKLLLLGKHARQQFSSLLVQHAFGTLPLTPVLEANVLGIIVGSDAPVDWESRVHGVEAAFTRLAHIPQLSIFGRGMGSSSYGVSKLLFAAEYYDVIPDVFSSRLNLAEAKLVDRGLAPASHERRFAGVASHFLVGRPAEGGFGALPWMEHIRARHAWWGAYFATAPVDTNVPWVCIGRTLLRQKCKWWGPLALFDSSSATQSPMPVPHSHDPHPYLPPPPLRRMFSALQVLGPTCDVAALQDQQPGQQLPQQQPQPQPQQQQLPLFDIVQLQQDMSDMAKAAVLQPGDWCALAPVFANKFLPCTTPLDNAQFIGAQALPVQNTDSRVLASNGGFVRPHIRTVAELFCAWYVINHAHINDQPHPLLSADPASNVGNELADINALIAQLPRPWVGAVLNALNGGRVPDVSWRSATLPDASVLPSAAEQIVESMLVSRLGWMGLPSGKPVLLTKLTVKQATSLQLGPLRAARREKHVRFVCGAVGGSMPLVVDAGLKLLYTAFKQCWKLRWDNAFKEVYWRLTLDGLPTAARMHMQSYTCLCGDQCPTCAHHFWLCPIACAVVDTIEAELQPPWCRRTPGSTSVQRQHIWLMHPPQGDSKIHHGVWRIVCLAAINAMHVGLTAANKHHHQQSMLQSQDTPPAVALPPGQSRITQWLAPAALTEAQQQHQHAVRLRREQQQQQVEQLRQLQLQQLLTETKQQAVARFWELMTDWVVLNPFPPGWIGQVAVDHPFLCRDAQRNTLILSERSAAP